MKEKDIIAEDYIEFVDRNKFYARVIVVVADNVTLLDGGRAHGRSRGWGKGNAYCYEEIVSFPKN